MRDALRNVELFAGLDDADLDRLLAKGERVTLAAGDVLFEEGAEGDRAYVVESGEMEIVKRSRTRDVLVKTSGAGEVIGEMAILQATPRTATVRACNDAMLLAIDGDAFRTFVRESPDAAGRMLETMFDRWRETDSALRESDRLAQLGSLSAGVAHELNNPAAAIGRAAARLSELLADEESAGPPEWSALEKNLGAHPVMSSLDRSDAEDAMEDALQSAGVEDPWDRASTLVDLGVTPDDVPGLLGAVADPSTALAALARRHQAASLAREIQDASGRISAIVGSLRSYTYLDRGARQAVDVNRGLADTLVMLRGRIKHLAVATDYADDLPLVDGHGGELNQVWTNLLVNAADALGKSGHIHIRTRHEGAWVIVEIEDDGPGIPEEVKDQVFDPFFTTKPIGEGTGVGLDISRHIVQEQHGGALDVESEPGRTVFTVRLPVE
ncbi:MAG TPA: ATP-binding protein [Acidimicrobiia bacterium]|jgi:signal transduction histidine kinase|nr:ATP-binding protein [Acidimicrobiia bacterium]